MRRRGGQREYPGGARGRSHGAAAFADDQVRAGQHRNTPENAGKGTALAYLAQYLGLEREQVMAMGDAENDLSMLEYAEHSVAMANASDRGESRVSISDGEQRRLRSCRR